MAFSFFKKNDNKPAAHVNEKYYHLKVREVIRETSDAVSLVFDTPSKPMNYLSGQFLTLIMQVNGEKIRRAYSLCSSSFVDEYPAVTVKKVEGGKMSTWINDTVKAGDIIEVMEPMGHFTTTYKADQSRTVVLLGGGSGITPLMSITKSVLDQEPNSRVVLIYANRNMESVIFRTTLEEMQRTFGDRLHVVHILDVPPVNWTGPSGIPTVDLLSKLITQEVKDLAKAEYFICGPQGMMDNAENALLGLSVAKEKIRKESFTSAADKKPVDVVSPSTASGLEVKVIYDGEEHVFTVPANKTILETALGLDIDLPYSCQSGLCTACRGKCLSGEVHLDESEGLSQSEINEGYVLTCVGHPKSPGVVIEIG